MSFNTRSIASDWTSAFALALGNADVTSLTPLFLHDGWLRDLLVFTWDFRSLSGRDKITSYLEHTLAPAQIIDVELDTTSELAPRSITVPQLGNAEAIQVVFTFQCARGPGRALANLLRDADGDWKALTVFFELLELRGYEEGDTLPCRDELKVNAGRDMSHDFAEYVKRVEEHPYALIGKHVVLLSLSTAYPFSVIFRSGMWADRLECRGPVQADEHPHPRDRA